ncbi:MAG TPA: ABC-2 family transporter protein [Devosia sp.]
MADASPRADWVRQLRLIPVLMLMNIRGQMEYRGAFWIDRIAQIITYGSSFAVLWILVARFDTLAGWNWADLALLYSFHMLSYSIGASMSFTQMRDLEEHIRVGTLDVMLIRPMSPWLYLIFSRFNAGYASHVILGVTLMVWALLNVEVQWSPGTILYFAASLLSAAMLTTAIMTMIGATALVWTRSNHLYSLYFGFWELSRYPLNIFPAAIQGVMLTIIPLAFMAAVPTAVLLGKPVPLLGDWAAPAALLAGPVRAGLAGLFWRYGINKYQGAGG